MIAYLSRAWAYFIRALRHATTARDNETTDLIRVTGLAVAVQFIWLSAANWGSFDPVAYATGAGLILSALGVAMRVARPTEPGA